MDMRLIDADELLTRIRLNYNDHQNVSAFDIKDIISTTPTIYNVDKIVKELYKIGNDAFNNVEINRDYYNGVFDGISQAIEIVRKGGNNEED